VRVPCAVAAIRQVRRPVAAALEVAVGAHDYDRGGKPGCAWDDQVARDALVSADWFADALAIIDCLPVTGFDEEQERAVALLRWSPARTSSRARRRAAGGPPGRSPRTGSCRSWIRRRGMRTSRARPTTTGSRATSQWRRRAG